MDFASLQHMLDSKVHFCGRIPPLPSFRLQGLDTLLTVYSLRNLVNAEALTALLGFSPSKHHRSSRYYDVSIVLHPPAVQLALSLRNFFCNRLRWPRLLGFDPCEPAQVSPVGVLP